MFLLWKVSELWESKCMAAFNEKSRCKEWQILHNGSVILPCLACSKMPCLYFSRDLYCCLSRSRIARRHNTDEWWCWCVRLYAFSPVFFLYIPFLSCVWRRLLFFLFFSFGFAVFFIYSARFPVRCDVGGWRRFVLSLWWEETFALRTNSASSCSYTITKN